MSVEVTQGDIVEAHDPIKVLCELLRDYVDVDVTVNFVGNATAGLRFEQPSAVETGKPDTIVLHCGGGSAFTLEGALEDLRQVIRNGAAEILAPGDFEAERAAQGELASVKEELQALSDDIRRIRLNLKEDKPLKREDLERLEALGDTIDRLSGYAVAE